MNKKDVRWRQRFDNFEKAFKQLQDAVSRVDELDDLSKEGLVQRFEYTFELAWKTLKDYLESKGVKVSFPRDTIKQAFATGVIKEGDIWLEMLDSRNLTAHTYDEENFNKSVNLIVHKYFGLIKELYVKLKNEQ